MNREFDPVETEILKNALESLVDEMAMTVLRTAYSNNLKNSMDFSTALCQPSGELIAQGLTLPLASRFGAARDREHLCDVWRRRAARRRLHAQ